MCGSTYCFTVSSASAQQSHPSLSRQVSVLTCLVPLCEWNPTNVEPHPMRIFIHPCYTTQQTKPRTHTPTKTQRSPRRLCSEEESGKDCVEAMQRAGIAASGAMRRITQTRRLSGGHGGGGGWWAEGTQEGPNGVLFNETPPPPGQSRKWEDWELPYYATGILTTVLLTVGLSAKPDTRIETWAHKQALERLAAEEAS